MPVLIILAVIAAILLVLWLLWKFLGVLWVSLCWLCGFLWCNVTWLLLVAGLAFAVWLFLPHKVKQEKDRS